MSAAAGAQRLVELRLMLHGVAGEKQLRLLGAARRGGSRQKGEKAEEENLEYHRADL